jgi:very-short-patch-repair endonuclease
VSAPRPAAEVVRRLGGTATRAELHRWTTRRCLDAALAGGAVRRARRGVYVLPELPEAHHLAAAVRGVVSHETAARELGLATLLPPAEVQLTVPRGRRHVRVPAGVRVHYAHLDDEELTSGTTSPLRTVLDVATRLPLAQALAVADSALRDDLVGARELVEAALRSAGPGRPRRIRVARLADPEAANPFESGLRACVLEAGHQGFVPQYRVPCTPHRVDLADPGRRIVLEADSFAHHGSRGDLHRDCTRYDELVRRGWVVLRFSWEHVMFQPDWVAQVVTDTCVRRGPQRRQKSAC